MTEDIDKTARDERAKRRHSESQGIVSERATGFGHIN